MFGPRSRREITQLIAYVASLLLETRDYAKEKLAAVTPIVGYKEDGWLTEGFMEQGRIV